MLNKTFIIVSSLHTCPNFSFATWLVLYVESPSFSVPASKPRSVVLKHTHSLHHLNVWLLMSEILKR